MELQSVSMSVALNLDPGAFSGDFCLLLVCFVNFDVVIVALSYILISYILNE